MIREVVLLQLGETMNEGTIDSWLKREGDRVEKGESLCGIETDKAVIPVDSPVSGYLVKILVEAGQTVPVLTTIGLIADRLDEAPGVAAPGSALAGPVAAVAATSAADAATTPAVANPPAETSDAPLRLTPAARRVARENGLDPQDLRDLKGTGPGGRVVEADVLRHVAELREAAAEPAAPSTSPAAPRAGEAIPPIRSVAPEVATPATSASDVELVPLSRMRRVIAERLAQSYREAVHVTLNAEADMAEASKLRRQLSAEWEARHGVRVTFTDLIVKAVAKALAENPKVNASFAADGIRRHRRVNVGVAVAVENGLLVPVVHDAADLPLLEIARKVRSLTESARLGQLRLDDLQGGTFSVTNMGTLGVDHFTPIINTGEGAILGVGQIADRPLVVDGALAIRPTVPLSLSFDHRLLDGAEAAAFLARVRQILESPYLILV